MLMKQTPHDDQLYFCKEKLLLEQDAKVITLDNTTLTKTVKFSHDNLYQAYSHFRNKLLSKNAVRI